MNFTYTAQPTGTDIVSLADMKLFLRVDHSDEDATITAIIDAATQSIQDYTGRHFKTTTWLLTCRDFNDLDVPYSANTVTGISYYEENNNSAKTLDTSKYYSGIELGIMKIIFRDTPTVDPYRIAAVNVIGSVANQINPPLTHAIKMLAAHYFENRRAVVVGTITAVIPFGIKAIINPYRLISLK